MHRFTTCIVLSAFFSGASFTVARADPLPAPSPVPAELLSAKSVFLAKGENPCVRFAAPDQPYLFLYAALRQWGHYQLAPSPAAAQLELVVSFACPVPPPPVLNGDSLPRKPHPMLTLAIRGAASGRLLWTLNEPVEMALLQSHRNHNLEAGAQSLVRDLRALGSGLPPQPKPPRWGQSRGALVTGIVAAAAGTALFVLLWARRPHISQPPPLPPPSPLPPFPLFGAR